MFVLSESDVAALLPMADVISAVESALRAQAAGAVHQPTRVAIRTPAGMFASMPCSIEGVGLGAKLVSFFPDNAARKLHTHHAVIAMFEPLTGEPLAFVDGRLITEMRTAATSAIATRLLARAGAGTVAVLGAGVQARSHVRALSEIGMAREVRVWGKTPAHVDAIIAQARERGAKALAAPTSRAACDGADIICTLTPSLAPIVADADVAPGVHINAVGSSAPHMQELPPELVGRARLFVDTVEGALIESGDILAAIRSGKLPSKPDLTRLCDVVAGAAAGRTDPAQVTVFKSLGMAIEDIACAALAVERARERGLGSALAL